MKSGIPPTLQPSFPARRSTIAGTFVLGLGVTVAGTAVLEPPSFRAALRSSLPAVAYLAAGLAASLRRPTNRMGLLLSAVGIAMFLPVLLLRVPVAPIGLVGSWMWGTSHLLLLAGAILSYPEGRITTTGQRRLFRAICAVVLLTAAVDALVVTCRGCAIPAPIDLDRGGVAVVRTGVLVVSGLGSAALLAMIAARWLTARGARRWVLAPVLFAGAGTALGVGIGLQGLLPIGAGGGFPAILLDIVQLLIPISLAVGFLRLHISRSAIGQIAVELSGEPSRDRLQQALIRKLRDPSITVGLWSAEANSYVNREGERIELPAPGSGRSLLLLEHHHEPLAIISYDSALDEDPALVRSVAAIAELAAKNEHLQQELVVRGRELKTARNRVVAESDGSGTTDLIRGRYEPLTVVGGGGQGRVLKALDYQHGRNVALKVRPFRTEEERLSLLQEARMLLAVTPHPALPTVRDDFFEDGSYYLVMDWIDGVSLESELNRRGDPGLPFSEVADVVRQAADGLDHLHRQVPPIVHQDVKPANLVLTQTGSVVLVDFGLSGFTFEERTFPYGGTSGFVAPELLNGENPTPSADVYGLAATTFALLTGGPPRGELPQWTGIPAEAVPSVERAIRTGLSIQPAGRQASAGRFVSDLTSGLLV